MSEATSEQELAVRVIDTLLRENYGHLSRQVHLHGGSPVLRLPARQGRPEVALPLEPDGFLADFRIRRTPPGAPLTLDDVDAVLAAVGDPRDRAGIDAFAAECRQALAALWLRERCLPAVRAGLAQQVRADPGALLGASGYLDYEALAAALPHPAYPASESRLGFSEEDSLRYAPEYRPEFGLRWVAVPHWRQVTAGQPARPRGWPTPRQVGLPDSLAASHDLMPVHPLTARLHIATALAEAGLCEPAAQGVLAPGITLRVRPTLSTRTVAIVGQPRTHLKLPLPTSTLGLLNRRSIQPGTLADGALVQRILATAVRGDPLLDGLLLADEGSYAHAGHPYLGYLLRELPEDIDGCRVVPIAALLAPAPDADPTGRPLVIEELAPGASAASLLGDYLGLLFRLHVRLFARYGLALEAHQQNTALVLSRSASPRLLVKDLDGTLIHLPRLAAALGPAAPGPSAFADPRLLTRSDDALADVFITITVHLCAGALAFGLARRSVAPLPDLLSLIRSRLLDALEQNADWPASATLRARVLDADRLPGKSMVTAGTLVAKSRTGASDINKFYGTNGPNYLKVNDDPRSCE